MTMPFARAALCVTLAAGSLVSIAAAQDSVSTTNGLPGDAVSAYTTGASQTQVLNFIVDTTTKTTSWGNQYRLAPLLKSSASTSSAYFNHLIASQAVSNKFTPVQSLPRTSYRRWATAGGGVNPTRNASGTLLSSNGITGHTFGVALLEYAGGPNAVFGDGDDESNIVSALASFNPSDPSRLYVSRIVTAINRANANVATYGNASFGLGGIDENGNVAIIADGFTASLGDDPITNKRYYRIAAASRSSSLANQLRGAAVPVDGTATSLVYSTTNAIVAPTIIPASVASRPVVVGADFQNNELVEQTAGSLTALTSHVSGGALLRGPISYTAAIFAPLATGGSDAGTGIALSRGSSETKTRGISVWGLNTNGTTDLTNRFALPTNPGDIVDAADGFNPANAFGSLGNQEFMNYQSQVCFRGPSGPVSGTVLPDGSLLLAAGVAATGGGASTPQSMDNYIAVCRVDPATQAATWSIAAHTGNSTGAAGGQAKAIYGTGGSIIGSLAKYNEAFPSATTGPSISAPAMDRLGNIYFFATISLNSSPSNTFTTGLLRANRDAATSGYKLELIAQVGDIFAGQNSARNYQIQFLGVADADSVDSGAVWPSNIVQDLPSGVSASGVGYGSPQSLGAMVFRARIVYDYNNDGLFVDPSQPGGSGSTDQAYNVLMALLPGPSLRCSPADIAYGDGEPLPPIGLPGGFNPAGPDGGDFDCFFNFYFAAAPDNAVCDIAYGDGEPLPPFGVSGGFNPGVDGGDFDCFFNFYFTGCP